MKPGLIFPGAGSGKSNQVSFSRQADAIVVGAGPAGSVAALLLARAGLDVRLLDRAQFPRDKLCGDTLNPGSLSILDRVSAGGPEGPPLSLADRIRARALAVTGMTVTGPGAMVSADYPPGLLGAAITRRDLDLLLVELAAAAGVRLETGLSVREPLMSDDGSRVAGVRVSNGHDHLLRARIVIAADGRGSRLATALGLSRFAAAPRRWAFGAYFEGVSDLSAHGEMHIRGEGYIGVAPLPDGTANVCVVREVRRGAPRIDQERVIDETVASDPMLRDRFAGATRVSGVTALGPLAVESRDAGCPGLLLAGDAAGFVDPMTGDGLRFALRGGELAAHAALRELASGVPAFSELGLARRREFAAKWRINRAIRSLVGSPRSLRFAALIARHWTAPVEYLIGVAGDVSLAMNAGSGCAPARDPACTREVDAAENAARRAGAAACPPEREARRWKRTRRD